MCGSFFRLGSHSLVRLTFRCWDLTVSPGPAQQPSTLPLWHVSIHGPRYIRVCQSTGVSRRSGHHSVSPERLARLPLAPTLYRTGCRTKTVRRLSGKWTESCRKNGLDIQKKGGTQLNVSDMIIIKQVKSTHPVFTTLRDQGGLYRVGNYNKAFIPRLATPTSGSCRLVRYAHDSSVGH